MAKKKKNEVNFSWNNTIRQLFEMEEEKENNSVSVDKEATSVFNSKINI